jgi:hypothetical protein
MLHEPPPENNCTSIILTHGKLLPAVLGVKTFARALKVHKYNINNQSLMVTFKALVKTFLNESIYSTTASISVLTDATTISRGGKSVE